MTMTEREPIRFTVDEAAAHYRAAQDKRDEGMARAEEHAPESWLTQAGNAIAVVARLRREFTSDAVWALLAHWKVPPPHEPRALGPAMKRAMREHICRSTGHYIPSTRAECNARPIMVYKSLIVDGSN